MNVGALSFQLARLEGDDVDVALRKERRTTRVKTGLFSASHRHAGGKTTSNTGCVRSRSSRGVRCWLWFCHKFSLGCYIPVFAVTTRLETSDDLSEVGLPTVFADEAVLDVDDEMDILRHYDVILYLNDWIVSADAV